MKKFLKPSWLSVIFLIELPAFLLIELVSGGRRVLEKKMGMGDFLRAIGG